MAVYKKYTHIILSNLNFRNEKVYPFKIIAFQSLTKQILWKNMTEIKIY